MRYIIAVDPGTEKCGLAILEEPGGVLVQEVLSRQETIDYLRRWLASHASPTLVVGDRTGSEDFINDLDKAGMREAFASIHPVDEHLSSLEARRRYFEDNPPAGWRRLIPQTMQTPPEPYDDYVAIILAERYLSGRKAKKGP